MVAIRESAGEVVKLPVVRRRRSKPQKIEFRSFGRSAVLAARAVAGRRGLICDGHFESETGRANHEGHRRPGRPTIGRAESGMAVASGPNGDGQVATALRRSRSLGLPVPTQAKRRISARQSWSTADGDTCRVCKRAICRCTNRSRQQPWRPRRWQAGARRIRPAGEGPIQWN